MAIETVFWDDGTLKMEVHSVDGVERPHREDGPAVIKYYKGGSISSASWYRNGELFRRGGPAITSYISFGIIVSETWYEREGGVGPHREDGPAMIEYSTSTGQVDNVTWYWNGFWLPRVYSQHQFEKYVQEKIVEEVMEG